MKLLFLDDTRTPDMCALYMHSRGIAPDIWSKPWQIVRSYGQFKEWIKSNGIPDIISFDHDLGDSVDLRANLPISEWFDLENNQEFTGMDCAKWLVEWCMDNDLDLPKYIVHSANPSGSENIKGILDSYKKFRSK